MARERRFDDPEDRHDWSSLTVVFGEDGAVWQHRMALDAGGCLIFTFNPEAGVARLSERFDTDGALVERTVLDECGTREVTRFDAGGTQSWSSQTAHFDAQGQVTAQAILADDGSRTEVTFDPTDSASFTKIVARYTADGALLRTDTRYDDGSRGAVEHDIADAREWDSRISLFDCGNHLVQQITIGDDGSRTEVTLDPMNGASFAKIVSRYTADGALLRADTRYDDGSRDAVEYDIADSRAWSSRTSLFDADNHLVQQAVVRDDGSQLITHYDVNDSYDWTVWTSTVKDGIRTEWFDYDDGLGSGPTPVWPDSRFRYSYLAYDEEGHLTRILNSSQDYRAAINTRLTTNLDTHDDQLWAVTVDESGYRVQHYRQVILFDEGGSYVRKDGTAWGGPPNPSDITVRDAHGRLVLQIDQEAHGVYGVGPNSYYLTMDETLGPQRWAETRNADGEVTQRSADLDNGLRISLDYSHSTPEFIGERIMLTDLASGAVIIDVHLSVATENFHSSALTFA